MRIDPPQPRVGRPLVYRAGRRGVSAPELSVVICSLGRPSLDEAIRSVLASIAAAGTTAEVVLVWQGLEPPPPPRDGVRVLETLPAGVSHARNVGIAGAAAGLLGFVDDDEIAAESWAAGLLAGFEDGAGAVFGPVEPMDDRGRPHCAHLGDEPRWIGSAGAAVGGRHRRQHGRHAGADVATSAASTRGWARAASGCPARTRS